MLLKRGLTLLAKLHVLVPFEITLPERTQFKIYHTEKDGYQIIFDIPSRSERMPQPDPAEKIVMNGTDAFQADVITITFSKPSFERKAGSPIDPPEPIIQYALNYLLGRMKYVTKGPQVKPINFPLCQWRLEYLNDDGSELEESEGYIRGRGTHSFSVTLLGCDPTVWDNIFTLPNDFEPPAWHTLLIDARGALPHIGSALVLAATALEVFIAELLDELIHETPVPGILWKWINDRGDWQKEPSVEEQYDILLKTITGHSLKEDNELWEGFKNLKTARNSFVHKGVAKVGRAVLSVHETTTLIGKADAIISKIREWVPEQSRWPELQHQIKFQITKRLTAPTKPPSE